MCKSRIERDNLYLIVYEDLYDKVVDFASGGIYQHITHNITLKILRDIRGSLIIREFDNVKSLINEQVREVYETKKS